MKNLILFFAILFLSSCGDNDSSSCTDGVKNGSETDIDCGGDCAECELPFFGLFDGTYVARTDTSEEAVDTSISVNVVDCNNDCFELTIQHDLGFSTTDGTYTKSGSIYSLKVNPILENPVLPGEPAVETGVGTFDVDNNSLSMTFRVSDGSGIWSSNHFAIIEASHN